MFRFRWFRNERQSAEVTIPILGIDVGTGGTRAVVLDEAGRTVASGTEEHAAFVRAQPGWTEQDPRAWWRAATLSIRKALKGAGIMGDAISCFGLSGQMHGAVLHGLK